MKTTVAVILLALAALAASEVPPKGIEYCTNDASCENFNNEYKMRCDTSEDPNVCKPMVPIVSTGGSPGGDDYCLDLFRTGGFCKKTAQTGCEFQAGYTYMFECADVESWYNDSRCEGHVRRTAEESPCTSNGDCLAPSTCENNLLDPTAQRTCKLPVAIGQRCWSSTFGDNLPCDFGECVGYVCKPYAKPGERCHHTGGYPSCDPFHICNRGICVPYLSVDEGKPCSSDASCGTLNCDGTAGICSPETRQRCMGDGDCPDGATCKKGVCFRPVVFAYRSFLKCVSNSKIFTETAPGRNLTDLVIAKCMKPLTRLLCSSSCFTREENFGLVSDLDIMDMPMELRRAVSFNCKTGQLTPLDGQCELRPTDIWQRCDAVGHYAPAGVAAPLVAVVAVLAAVAAFLF